MGNVHRAKKCISLLALAFILLLSLSAGVCVQGRVYGVVYSLTQQVLSNSGREYEVTVTYDERAGIPEDSVLAVREIDKDSEEYERYFLAATDALEGQIDTAGFLDISILKDGEKVEPDGPVRVKIKELHIDRVDGAVPKVLHFPGVIGEVAEDELVEEDEESLAEEAELLDVALLEDEVIQFTADSFSVYGVIYTVDFRYEVDGKVYDFSIPGGGFVSLEHLVEALRIALPDEDGVETELVSGVGDSLEKEEKVENEQEDEEQEERREQEEIDQDDEEELVEESIASYDDEAIDLNELEISEETKNFVANVEKVEFSNPELVWVGKVEEESTVGSLKEANALDVEYSALLTKKQIEEINAQKVEAEDWALISLLPFDTEEVLLVTMKDGEQFSIEVTDAQIKGTFISANGENYEVTVIYGEDAGIPENSSLRITEFSYGSDEYRDAYHKVVEYKKATDSRFSEIGMGFEAIDVSIIGPDGKSVEPMAQVRVSITRNNLLGNAEGESFLETAEVQHIVETEGESIVSVVAGISEDVDGSITISDGSAVASFIVDHFSTYTISWGGGLTGRPIQNITTGDYIVYAYDANDGYYYALVPSTNTNNNLSSVRLNYNNGVISYSGNTNLYWYVTVSGSGNNRTFSMSYSNGNNTYYVYPVNANLYDGYTSNLRVRTTSYTWSNWANHIFCAGDTFLRSYNGMFQVWNQNNGNWQSMTNISFATVADIENVKVHYGYMDGNTFKEFDDLPEGAQASYGAPSMIGDQLNVRYDIPGKDYMYARLNNPVSGTLISPMLQTEANSAAYWRYRVQSTTTVNGGINEWQQFGANDKDIYVIYRDTPTQKSYDTGDITPEDLEAPIATKAFESNHDGTYDLILGVTGKSNQAEQKTHANVVIVLDTSSSMNGTKSDDTGEELGYTRLSAAQGAICNLADQLFALNSTDDPAAIELAFVNFSHRVRNEQTMQIIYSGTDPTTFKNMINATNGNGGTNYDTAIEAANSILWKDADPTYVVFVTDGDTVSRGYLKYNSDGDESDHASDWDGGTYYNGDTSTYGDTYLERAREAAKIQVNKVLASGKKFYSIGVFGHVAYLNEMGGNYLGKANDQEAIKRAFSKIISEIQLNLGYKDVVINDGVTALTSTKIQHGSAGNFIYYRSGGKNANDTEKYSSTQNNGRGEIWDIEEGSDKEAFFLEIKDESTFLKNGTRWTDITDEQKRNYIDKYGIGSRNVIWDLGTEMLEDGVTYKVAFTVWPSQEAYDLVANLNNGTVKFSELHSSVTSQIVEENGVYYVKTNTNATVDYTSVKTEDGTVTEQNQGSAMIRDPNGKMNLDTNLMTVRKEFAHLINEADPYEEIVFYLLVDGKYYNKDGTLSDTLDEAKVYAINLPKNNQWEDQIYIAPGLMRGGEILETGHNYTLVEKIVSGNPYEYEFTSQTVRPMVIKTVPTFLVKKDTYNTNAGSKKEYTFNDAESSYLEVNGTSNAEGTYYAESENNGSLVGVNHKTSELDITKIIDDPQNVMTDAQEATDTFTYRVTLQIPDGCDPSGIVGYEYVPRTQSNAYTLFGYQTGQGAFANDISRFNGKTFRAWNTLVYDALIEYDRVTENEKTSIKAKHDADGNIIWKVQKDSEGYHTITYDMTLKQDEVIRFTNLPSGTKYTIQEIYANKYPADNAGGKTDGRNPVSDTSNLASEGYQIENVQHTGGTLSADKTTVTGTIEAPDTRYYNQFTNKKKEVDKTIRTELIVKKVVEDYTWGSEYYQFTLSPGTAEYRDTEGGSGTSPMPDGENTSVVRIYDTTVDHTQSFGNIRYTRPGVYTYQIKESDNTVHMPYVQFAPPVTITITVEADTDGKLKVSKIEDDKEATVYTEENATALAAGLTTQTNTPRKIHIKKVDANDTDKLLSGAMFEIRSGDKLYLQDGKLLTAAEVRNLIGEDDSFDLSTDEAVSAMESRGILSRFTLGELDLYGFIVNFLRTVTKEK